MSQDEIGIISFSHEREDERDENQKQKQVKFFLMKKMNLNDHGAKHEKDRQSENQESVELEIVTALPPIAPEDQSKAISFFQSCQICLNEDLNRVEFFPKLLGGTGGQGDQDKNRNENEKDFKISNEEQRSIGKKNLNLFLF